MLFVESEQLNTEESKDDFSSQYNSLIMCNDDQILDNICYMYDNVFVLVP